MIDLFKGMEEISKRMDALEKSMKRRDVEIDELGKRLVAAKRALEAVRRLCDASDNDPDGMDPGRVKVVDLRAILREHGITGGTDG